MGAAGLGSSVIFMGGDGFQDTKFTGDAGSAGNGAYSTIAAPNVTQLSSATTFVSDYMAKYGSAPGAYTANAYDAMNILLQAVKSAVTANGGTIPSNPAAFRESVRAAIAAINYSGAIGTTSFDANGDTTKTGCSPSGRSRAASGPGSRTSPSPANPSASSDVSTRAEGGRTSLRFALQGSKFPLGVGLAIVLILVFSIAVHGAAGTGTEVVIGLQIGGTYALIAVGYTMVYGIIELINFAHGDVFTLSAFYAIFIVGLSDKLHLPLNGLATQHGLLGLVAALAHPHSDHHGPGRTHRHADRARRLSAASRLAAPRAADHRDRGVLPHRGHHVRVLRAEQRHRRQLPDRRHGHVDHRDRVHDRQRRERRAGALDRPLRRRSSPCC